MTGIIVATIIIGLIVLVGGIALFMLLPILLALVGVVVLVLVMAVVAILMVPNFITLDNFKPEIIGMLEQATGREITIGGPIGFTVWPVLGLQLRDISVGNPEGSKDPIFLAAQEVGVGVTLSSLMDRRLELRELRVVEGQLNLTTDTRGGNNWTFSQKGEGSSKPSEHEQAESQKSGDDFSIKDIQISKIEILRTNISYDPARGEPLDLDNINLAVTMPSLDQPLDVKGSVNLRQQDVKLEGRVDKPRALMANTTTPVTFTLGLLGDELRLTGELTNGNFKGDVTAGVANLSKLASWASGSAASLPLSTVSLMAKVDATAERANLSNISLKADDMTLTGKFSAQWAVARPRVTADVDVSKVDLDRFMAADSSAASASSGSSSSGAAPDLSFLDKLNADIAARLGGLVYKGATLGSTKATVVINNGRMNAAITPASLYEGTVSAKADVSAAARGGRTFSTNIVLDGVQVGPVLQQFAGNDRLTGKGDLTLSLSGPLASTDVMKREIDGDGKFMFRDGALKGVNIAALVRDAKAVLGGGRTGGGTDGPVQTDFTELSGTFRINNGVVTNNDLKMLSPLVRVTGRGMASLPADNVDYRIEAALVADLTGQGGAMERRGLVIPVNVRGPFAALKYEPDLQGLVLGNVGVAKDIGAAVQQLGTKEGQRGARDTIKNILGLPSRTQQPEAAPAAPAPESALAPEAAPAPAPTEPAKPADVLRGLLTR